MPPPTSNSAMPLATWANPIPVAARTGARDQRLDVRRIDAAGDVGERPGADAERAAELAALGLEPDQARQARDQEVGRTVGVEIGGERPAGDDRAGQHRERRER